MMNNGCHNYQVDVGGECVGENIPVVDVGVANRRLVGEEILRAAVMIQTFKSWLKTAERKILRDKKF